MKNKAIEGKNKIRKYQEDPMQIDKEWILLAKRKLEKFIQSWKKVVTLDAQAPR